jgi:hypothetical protein
MNQEIMLKTPIIMTRVEGAVCEQQQQRDEQLLGYTIFRGEKSICRL